MQTELVDIASLHLDPANVRRHDRRNLDAIKASLARFKQQTPLVVDQDGIVRKGNGTLQAAKELGWEKIAAVRTTLTGAEATAYSIADNRSGDPEVGSTFDDVALAQTLAALQNDASIDELVTGFTEGEIDKLIGWAAGLPGEIVADNPKMVDQYGAPPFSVLDARQGYWQDRKRAWLALGIQSELGRGEQLIPNGGGHDEQGGIRERESKMRSTPPHGPTVTRNPDGTLCYRGSKRSEWRQQRRAAH